MKVLIVLASLILAASALVQPRNDLPATSAWTSCRTWTTSSPATPPSRKLWTSSRRSATLLASSFPTLRRPVTSSSSLSFPPSLTPSSTTTWILPRCALRCSVPVPEPRQQQSTVHSNILFVILFLLECKIKYNK